MISRQNEPAEKMLQPVFILRGIPYYPHYSERHRWVGPGRKTECKIYTTAALAEFGAELVTELMWPRSWTEEVRGWRTM